MIEDKKNTLNDIYVQFSCADMYELIQKYNSADQELMYSGSWDYKNKELLLNQIKVAIERVDFERITDSYEKEWYPHFLWLWYHHAITCALWKYGDKKSAQEFSEKALSFQSKNHPNKITRLLHLLTVDDIDGALKWAETITTEPEKSTARYDIALYKKKTFFDSQ